MILVVLGAGGYGRTVVDVAEESGKYDSVLVLDDGNNNDYRKCCRFVDYVSAETEFYPAFGSNELRVEWIRRLKNCNAHIANIISENAYVSNMVKKGEGIAVLPGAIVNTGSDLEDGVIINM